MREVRACRMLENIMTQPENTLMAELHFRAAYAHTAAAHGHSTGDHATPLELARNAHERSLEAVKYTEEAAAQGALPEEP